MSTIGHICCLLISSRRSLGAFCKDAIDLYVPNVIIRNHYTSSLLRKHPRRIQTLFTRKRCVWRQMRSNSNDIALRSNYKRLLYECREAIKDYERSQEDNSMSYLSHKVSVHSINSLIGGCTTPLLHQCY